MELRYDKKNDTLSICFQKQHYRESDEIQPGIIFDYDAAGRVMAIEVLEASKRLPARFRATLLRKQVPVVLG